MRKREKRVKKKKKKSWPTLTWLLFRVLRYHEKISNIINMFFLMYSLEASHTCSLLLNSMFSLILSVFFPDLVYHQEKLATSLKAILKSAAPVFLHITQHCMLLPLKIDSPALQGMTSATVTVTHNVCQNGNTKIIPPPPTPKLPSPSSQQWQNSAVAVGLS